MTKKELIEQTMRAASIVPGCTHLPLKEVESVIDALALVAARQLARGHDFTLPDIAKFKLVENAARAGRNPRTGEAIQIPAKLVVKVKALKALNDAIAERNTMEAA